MPPNTAKVDRTTRWGNYPAARAGVKGAEAVRAFAEWVEGGATPEWKRAAIFALQGKRLACWCKTGTPCHADFLLAWLERASAEAKDPVRTKDITPRITATLTAASDGI